ncbi:glycosyl hydrolase family protein [Mycolicibacterium sp. CH28]|uniref:glycoside hydrolase family 16 protein n=1 Tax=Mycolicibacterium sp. CH28 TaxID=2512237 RepID=UPI0010819894|nr:glycoside hydrolase family 16 protein [Mycolicibacterium sp. CH28]TGD86838.1 glycosyl hydrolase family protein [Mycolicibacterium sp. CH28]
MLVPIPHVSRVATSLIGVVSIVFGLTAASAARLQPIADADSGNGNCPNTAAAALGWGEPNRQDNFDNPASLGQWTIYDGPGHDGNGRRTPNAVSVAGGTLTITGDSAGNSAGMAWLPGQFHGRWEACIKSSPSGPGYHSLALLWPDAENWPLGGEVDFMEIAEPSRQTVEGWLHYGPNDERETGSVNIDATQWHSWAVEWTPQRMAMFVDGVQWWESTDPAHFPPGPMHLCIQLDNFGGDLGGGATTAVEWARQYSL